MLERIYNVIVGDSETFLLYLKSHITICLYAIVISSVIGITLGVVAGKREKLGSVIVNFANFINMIPTLALLILIMPIMGSGRVPALFALCIVCIPVQLINTRLGILSVEPQILEAADGVGMSRWRKLFTIEIPLALPMIFVGIRTSMIQSIASATIASYIGSNSLGNYIVFGFSSGSRSTHLLLVGAGSIAILTLLADSLMHLVQRVINRRFSA